jgi:deoxyribonuclease-4
LRIGSHTSVKGAYYNGMADGKALGCETVQIFTSNPRGWAFRKYKEGEVADFQAKRQETGIHPVFAHANYLINIASSDAAITEKSRTALLEEVNRIETLGMEFVVLHPGSYKDKTPEEGVQNAIQNLTWVFDQTPKGTRRILIENTAGQGNLLACTFEEIQTILDGIPKKYQNRVGMCFDTCHAFAYGYDLRTKPQYEEMIAKLDSTVGLNRVFAFHLNDCHEELASNRDLHEHIGKGHLGKEPFRFLLNDPRFKDHPGVLETEWGEDYADIKKDIDLLFSLRKA